MSTQVCSYYQRGNCRFGSQCRYLHPGRQTLANQSDGGNVFAGSGRAAPVKDSFTMPTAESIRIDLTERPTWLLSSYGPGKDPPCQLIDGKDVSPEEARLLAYQLREQNNFTQLETQWAQLNGEADTQIRNILKDINGALSYIQDAQNNKASTFRYYTPGQESEKGPSGPSALDQQVLSSPFGAPSQPTSAFGTQANAGSPFGAPSKPTSAFGQPLQPTSAFGQPSSASSPFGAPSQPAPGFGSNPFGQQAATKPPFGQPAFGQTSGPAASPFATAAVGGSTAAFGQPAFGQPAFGQTSGAAASPFAAAAAANKPAFGQPAFGQPTFGQTSGPTASPFATAAVNKPAFGQPAFGQTSGPAASPFAAAATAATPAFGKPAFGQPAFGQSPFAAAANATASNASPFTAAAAPTPVAANPFASAAGSSNASPFAHAVQSQQSPFAQAAQPNANPFASTTTPAPAAAAANPFAQPAQPQQQSPFASTSPFASAAQQPQSANSFPQVPPTQPVAMAGQHQQPSLFASASPFAQQGHLQPPKDDGPMLQEEHRMNQGIAAQNRAQTWADPPVEYAPQEVEWFAAPKFEYGKVPMVAPSQAMCWG